MSTLYRKYRPQLWSSVVDQNHVKMTLQNELETGHIAHAYLFSGPRGLGKTTIARLLAKSLNCEKRKKGTSEPCNTCSSCLGVLQASSLDVVEIDAASHTGVDNVREHVINASRVLPTASPYKVFIIDEVHMLSLSAFNALLKTLEEPPAHVVLILATTEIHRLPETIISRCQRFDFRKIPLPAVVERLRFLAKHEEVEVDDDVLDAVARLSEGSLRDAESVLGQIVGLGEKRITMERASLVLPRSDINAVLDFLEDVFQRNPAGAVARVNAFVAEGIDIDLFIRDVLDVLRVLLFRFLGSVLEEYTIAFDASIEKRMTNLQKHHSLDECLNILQTFFEAVRTPTSSPQLALELAVVSLAHTRESPPDISQKRPMPHKQEKPVSSRPSPASQLLLSSIQERWETVIGHVRKRNPSLAFLWEIAELLEYTNGTLTVGFSYPFHLDRARDQKNTTPMHDILQKVFGTPIHLEFQLIERSAGVPGEKERQHGILNDVLTTFGGRIVQT